MPRPDSATCQAELRRLMKAERERQKMVSSSAVLSAEGGVSLLTAGARTAAGAGPRPRGILRAPNRAGRARPPPSPPSSPQGEGALGGLLGVYGSDISEGEGSGGDEDGSGGENGGSASRAAAVGPSRPAVAFAPDVVLEPRARRDGGGGGGVGSPPSDGPEPRGTPSAPVGGGDGDGAPAPADVDPETWKEFEKLVGDDNDDSGRSRAAEGRSVVDSTEVGRTEAQITDRTEGTRPPTVAPSGKADARQMNGEGEKKFSSPEPALPASPPVDAAVEGKAPPTAFAADAAKEAVEQAAYEARLARLMLLRSRHVRPPERRGMAAGARREKEVSSEGENDEATTATAAAAAVAVADSSEADDAAAYAPALAFQEDEGEVVQATEKRAVIGKSDVRDLPPTAVPGVGQEGPTAGPIAGPIAATTSSRPDRAMGGKRQKRKPSSSLATEILRRKRARARQAARADEEDEVGFGYLDSEGGGTMF